MLTSIGLAMAAVSFAWRQVGKEAPQYSPIGRVKKIPLDTQSGKVLVSLTLDKLCRIRPCIGDIGHHHRFISAFNSLEEVSRPAAESAMLLSVRVLSSAMVMGCGWPLVFSISLRESIALENAAVPSPANSAA